MAIAICEENRFTKFTKGRFTPRYKAILNWLEWFTQRGIPAVISCHNGRYALYREGLIPMPDEDDE